MHKFSETYELPQNARFQKGDTEQVEYGGHTLTHIRSKQIKNLVITVTWQTGFVHLCSKEIFKHTFLPY